VLVEVNLSRGLRMFAIFGLPGIRPPMGETEALEAAAIASKAGLELHPPTRRQRDFRAPPPNRFGHGAVPERLSVTTDSATLQGFSLLRTARMMMLKRDNARKIGLVDRMHRICSLSHIAQCSN
jgi:hypothetical protein